MFLWRNKKDISIFWMKKALSVAVQIGPNIMRVNCNFSNQAETEFILVLVCTVNTA